MDKPKQAQAVVRDERVENARIGLDAMLGLWCGGMASSQILMPALGIDAKTYKDIQDATVTVLATQVAVEDESHRLRRFADAIARATEDEFDPSELDEV